LQRNKKKMEKALSYYKTPLKLIEDDPLLVPYESEIRARLVQYERVKSDIEADFGSLINFATAYQFLGLHYDKQKKGWHYREWAPAAISLSLIGDFNGWDPFEHPLTKAGNGLWEIFLPDEKYKETFKHGCRIKVHVKGFSMAMDRIPAYIQRVTQDAVTYDYAGQVWKPKIPFVWTDQNFKFSPQKTPFIYECHVGMALEKEGVGTWKEFVLQVLPRIQKLGYNCLQLMAVQEHPYYGSFGYHVSNFYAPSSRFGTPEDLKYLINEAHRLGIAVIMDIVHSHAVKNFAEGLNLFDGSENQYFTGEHPAWDSMLFDYGKKEVLMFLLSNLAYWLNEFHFDGFRFDGVTSILYNHHGLGVTFTEYAQYFGADLNKDALIYLRLANELVHEIKPNVITIAEDMSGMPGTCYAVQQGGLGFDYRLAMGIPDFWIKMVKHYKDEEWDLGEVWGTLINRRKNEPNIAYCESHDQALVGDKTLAFRLMDKDMYEGMSRLVPTNIVVERGIALHKIIRLLTISLGGEGYLNFMGNEFGHPDWIDFPREGNDWSYKYARRQWSLVENKDLFYQYLNHFDKEMIRRMKEKEILSSPAAQFIMVHNEQKVLVYERNGLIFVCNLHVHESYFGFRVRVPKGGKYHIVLNTDNKKFGGHGRIDETISHESFKSNKLGHILSIYLPSRTMLVLGK